MWYEIRVRGRLDSRWSAWFDGLTVAAGANGETVLTGPVADQAALHGLLAKVRDLGLPLIAVNPVDGEAGESSLSRPSPPPGRGDDP
jgi:hypothetical protein